MSSALQFSESPTSTARSVEDLLLGSATAQTLSLTQVARWLAVTPRTLQRRLRAEGTTYRAIVHRAAAKRAIRLLSEDAATIVSVAMALGFSEPGSFHRAFKRWTGAPPRVFLRATRAQ